jgi:hypothetical protein
MSSTVPQIVNCLSRVVMAGAATSFAYTACGHATQVNHFVASCTNATNACIGVVEAIGDKVETATKENVDDFVRTASTD